MHRMNIGMKKIQLCRALGRPPWTRARSRISRDRPLMIGLRLGFSIVERVEGWLNLEGVKEGKSTWLQLHYSSSFHGLYIPLVITSTAQDSRKSSHKNWNPSVDFRCFVQRGRLSDKMTINSLTFGFPFILILLCLVYV